jgi:hypothetical protein
MIRIAAFLAALTWPAIALGQVPPGYPYDPAKHANPILTYVTSADFKATTSSEAQKLAGRELLGLSQAEGRQESIDIAVLPSTGRKVKIGRQDVEVIFYSVVRQTFAVRDGGRLVLHSFKFPRLPVPLSEAAAALDRAAFTRGGKPSEARFGPANPERFEVRGREALLFDDGSQRTIFWVENGVVYTATSTLKQSTLVNVLEDLL